MNKLTKILGIKKPIILGPMYAMSNAELVTAVSKAGGLGIFGVDPIPLDGKKHTSNENLEASIKYAQKNTKNPFGIQIHITNDDPSKDNESLEVLQLMIKYNVPIAMVGGFSQCPSQAWIDLFHKNNIKVIYRANHNTIDDTKKALKEGVDVIGATGYEAGGEPTYIGLSEIVPLMADLINSKIPLFAVGGIADKRQVRAAFDLGADGVYVGTAFMSSKEAAINNKIKNLAVKTSVFDLNTFKFNYRFGRSLPGVMPNKLQKLTEEGYSREEVSKQINNSMGLYYGDIDGDLDRGITGHGQGVSFIKKIEPAEVILNRLYEGVPEDQR